MGDITVWAKPILHIPLPCEHVRSRISRGFLFLRERSWLGTPTEEAPAPNYIATATCSWELLHTLSHVTHSKGCRGGLSVVVKGPAQPPCIKPAWNWKAPVGKQNSQLWGVSQQVFGRKHNAWKATFWTPQLALRNTAAIAISSVPTMVPPFNILHYTRIMSFPQCLILCHYSPTGVRTPS